MLTPAPGSGVSVTPSSALASADVLACVRVIAHGLASCTLHAFRHTDGGRVRVRDGAADVLAQPASGVPSASFLAHVGATLALRGEAFIGLYRQDGRVASLGLLSPDRVEVSVLPNGEPRYRWTRTGGAPLDLTARDVAHVRLTSLDGLRGISPIAAARDAVGLAIDLQQHASASVANNAAPAGLLRVPSGPGADDQMEEVRQAWNTRHGGSKNTGRIAVLTGEVSFEAVSLPARDLQFIEQRGLSTAEIARLFGVPPWMVNAPQQGGSLTYSTVSQQSEAFARFTLAPWLAAIEQALSIVPDFLPSGVYVEANLDALLRGSSSERSAFYAAALDPAKGWMSRQEVRDRENLPPEAPQAPTPPSPTPTEAPA